MTDPLVDDLVDDVAPPRHVTPPFVVGAGVLLAVVVAVLAMAVLAVSRHRAEAPPRLPAPATSSAPTAASTTAPAPLRPVVVVVPMATNAARPSPTSTRSAAPSPRPSRPPSTSPSPTPCALPTLPVLGCPPRPSTSPYAADRASSDPRDDTPSWLRRGGRAGP